MNGTDPVLLALPGVQLVKPPAYLKAAIDASIYDAIGQLGPASTGGLIGIATRVDGKTAVNLAAVHRVGDTWQIGAYIGKTWGEPVGLGAFVRAEW